MAFFKRQSAVVRLEEQRAAIRRERDGLLQSVTIDAALEANPATIAHLAELNAREQLIAAKLPQAEAEDRAAADALRSEEEQWQAEAEARARKAAFEADKKYVQARRKGIAEIEAGAAMIAGGFVTLSVATEKFDATLPEFEFGCVDLPVHDRLWHDPGEIVRRALGHAGARANVEIPGASDEIPAQPPSIDCASLDKGVLAFARRVLIDGDLPKPPPESRATPKPEPPRKARLSYIAAAELPPGRNANDLIYVPAAGRSYWRADLEPLGWTFDHEGNPTSWPKFPAEDPVPQGSPDTAHIGREQAQAGRAADAALRAAAGFTPKRQLAQPAAAPAGPTPPQSDVTEAPVLSLPVIDAVYEMARASPLSADPEFAALQVTRRAELEARHAAEATLPIEQDTAAEAPPSSVATDGAGAESDDSATSEPGEALAPGAPAPTASDEVY